MNRSDPAFQLMLACTDWSADSSTRRRAIEQAHSSMKGDWDCFTALVERHHLVLPAIRELKKTEIKVPARLARQASHEQTRALRLCARSLKLIQHLEKQDSQAVLLKGPLLSDMIFGDPAIRHSSDIDILVDWHDFAKSIITLERLGLKLHKRPPSFESWQIDLWRSLAKDVTLFDPESGFTIELHHRLKSPATLLPGIGFADAQESHALGGMDLAVFPHDKLFVYLCAHGSTSLWHRLKWLADIHALVRRLDDEAIERMQAFSQSLGTERCSALALLLISDLWGRDMPRSVLELARTDRALKQLCDGSLKRLTGPERRYSSFANSIDRQLLMRLRRDSEYRKSHWLEIAHDRELLERYRLPKSLKWLYLPLRIVLFVQRKLGIR